MPRIQAILLDVYETVLTCDFTVHDVELPRVAGVPVDVWLGAWRDLGPELMEGRKSLAEAFDHVIRSAGRNPSSDLLRELVRLDQDLLLRQAELYEDTIPFLRSMRSYGIKTALVSNCAENTTALLDHLMLVPLVDAVVLSCEVGYAKPAREIYGEALRRLRVSPKEALLIDDQQKYCDGATAMGMGAMHIRRGAERGSGWCCSLLEAECLLTMPDNHSRNSLMHTAPQSTTEER